MLPKYRQLIKAGVKILVYSGDVDGIVPFTGTRNWLALLNLPVRSPQRPWYSDHQVGGYITEYDGLTFACVPPLPPLLSPFFVFVFALLVALPPPELLLVRLVDFSCLFACCAAPCAMQGTWSPGRSPSGATTCSLTSFAGRTFEGTPIMISLSLSLVFPVFFLLSPALCDTEQEPEGGKGGRKE